MQVRRARLTSTKELALRCQGKMEFCFSGYDDDPRELYEIQEVMRDIAALDAAFPTKILERRRNHAQNQHCLD